MFVHGSSKKHWENGVLQTKTSNQEQATVRKNTKKKMSRFHGKYFSTIRTYQTNPWISLRPTVFESADPSLAWTVHSQPLASTSLQCQPEGWIADIFNFSQPWIAMFNIQNQKFKPFTSHQSNLRLSAIFSAYLLDDSLQRIFRPWADLGMAHMYIVHNYVQVYVYNTYTIDHNP